MTLTGAPWIVIAVTVGSLLAGTASHASHLSDHPQKHRIVYQLDEPGAERAKFVLRNIANHVKGVGGMDNIDGLELVVFGPALKGFLTKDIDPEVRAALEKLQAQGLTFGACGNTMKGLNVTLADLPRGAHHLPQGGVVRIMELQEQGYSYIRP